MVKVLEVMGVAGRDHRQVDVLTVRLAVRIARLIVIDDAENATVPVFLHPLDANGAAFDQLGEIIGRLFAVGLIGLRRVDAFETHLEPDIAAGDNVNRVTINDLGAKSDDDLNLLGLLLPRLVNRLVDPRINRIGDARSARPESKPRLPRPKTAMNSDSRCRKHCQRSNRKRQQNAAPKPKQ